MKPFTTIAAILFLVVAAIHGYRLYGGFSVVIANHSIPMTVSWVAAAVSVVLGLALLSEARR